MIQSVELHTLPPLFGLPWVCIHRKDLRIILHTIILAPYTVLMMTPLPCSYPGAPPHQVPSHNHHLKNPPCTGTPTADDDGPPLLIPRVPPRQTPLTQSPIETSFPTQARPPQTMTDLPCSFPGAPLWAPPALRALQHAHQEWLVVVQEWVEAHQVWLVVV